MSIGSAEDDNFIYHYGYHMVSFLDLLGQKERLRSIEGILESDLEVKKNELQTALKYTVGTIWEFRKSFKDFFEKYLHHQPEIDVPEQIEVHFNQMRNHSKLNFQNFSDSIITWTPVLLKTDLDYAQVLNSIHGILTSVGMITPLYLSRKVPIRGGIDLEGGILVVPNGSEIYGPVLNRAYTLESKCAEYPRVLVGKGLIDFLAQIEKINLTDKILEGYCKMMAERCKRWIVTDDDHRQMVHFLGPYSKEIADDVPSFDYYREVIVPMNDFISECENIYQNDEKLRGRYKRLRSYFDRYIDIWK